MKLDSDFEQDLQAAMRDEIEQTLRGDIGPLLRDTAEEFFKQYAQRQGYDIEHIWQDASDPIVDVDDTSVSVRIEWPELTALFEFGVAPHTIDGSPLLQFVWDAPPEGTRPPGAPEFVVAESVNWGSVTGGIDEARAIRDAMNEVRRALQ